MTKVGNDCMLLTKFSTWLLPANLDFYHLANSVCIRKVQINAAQRFELCNDECSCGIIRGMVKIHRNTRKKPVQTRLGKNNLRRNVNSDLKHTIHQLMKFKNG